MAKTPAKDNSMHWVIGIVLLITGVLIIAALVVTYSSAQGGNVNANVNIQNDPPVIQDHAAFQDPNDDGGAVSFAFAGVGDTLTHTLGGNTNVIVNVNVFDSNGWAAQPITLVMRLIRTTTGGTGLSSTLSGAVTNEANALPKAGSVPCTAIVNVSATVQTWTCGINMKYLSDPTTGTSEVAPGVNYQGEHWRAAFAANDSTTTTVDNNTVHFEWPDQVGFSAPSLIDLGSIATDGIEGPVAPLAAQNLGNQQLDMTAQVTELTDAAAWSCTGTGNPLISDIHLGPETTDTNYGVMNPLNINGAAFTHADFDQTRDVDTAATTTKDMNFRMATTQAITPGTCTLSSVVLTAIKGF